MSNYLKQKYKSEICSTLKNKFEYKNIHEIPKLTKITLNRGLGLNGQNTSALNKTIEEFRLITGQQPIVTQAKKSIAGFKIREKMNLGVSVTLRDKKMYAFLERLINLVLPRIRDFRGLNIESFDRFGNYHFGLLDQLVFPEINYDNVDQTLGINISIVTTAKTKEESLELLKQLGFPFKKA